MYNTNVSKSSGSAEERNQFIWKSVSVAQRIGRVLRVKKKEEVIQGSRSEVSSRMTGLGYGRQGEIAKGKLEWDARDRRSPV